MKSIKLSLILLAGIYLIIIFPQIAPSFPIFAKELLARLTKDCKSKQTTNPKHLKQLFATKKCPRCNLGDANLSGVNLAEVDLSEALLVNANLDATNLQRANLSRAEFSWEDWDDGWGGRNRCNLHFQASLREANLSGANLTYAVLNDVDLRKANLENANLIDTTLSGTILQNANLEKANLTNVILRIPLMYGANLKEANLSNAKGTAWLANANLMNANLQNADLYSSNFNGANFKNSNLKGTNLADTDLKNANLQMILYDISTNWQSAKYNEKTLFSEEFDPLEKDIIFISSHRNN